MDAAPTASSSKTPSPSPSNHAFVTINPSRTSSPSLHSPSSSEGESFLGGKRASISGSPGMNTKGWCGIMFAGLHGRGRESGVRRLVILVGLVVLVAWGLSSVFFKFPSRATQSIRQHFTSSDYSTFESPHYSESRPPSELGKVFTGDGHLCDFCDCSNSVSHPFLKDVVSGEGGKAGDRQSATAIWSYIRDSYCHRMYISQGNTVNLLRRSLADAPTLSSTMQWNLTLNKPSIPTSYIFTKTSSAGRTAHAREGYFRRHIHTMYTHKIEVLNEGWLEDTVPRWGTERQSVWIVVEDDAELKSDVSEVLAESGLSYIYFAFGPTKHYGNAQQNAAYSLIAHLSDPLTGIYGHGPILSIDDDSNFLPSLLRLIWRVERIGVWPMGNLGPHGFEGPVYDEETKVLLRWEAGATSQRKFPIDNGAFTFRSELLGKEIPGPGYWPTDFSGGESEFMSLLVSKKEDIEPICYNCHVAWHNEPLPAACVTEFC